MNYRRKHIKPKIKKLRQKRKFYQMPLFWLVLLILIVIITIFYFLLFFSKFQISKITILGNEKVQTSDIESMTSQIINKKILKFGEINISTKSIFITDSKKIIKDILDNFPN